MTTHPFRDLTTVTPHGDGRYAAHIDPIWTIGPKVHGGCMMAVCAAAARRELADTATADLPVDPAAAPLAVSANYLAAPDPGEVDVVATVRKRGRQVSLVDVELSQNGRPAVHATVTLGVPDAGEPHYTREQALAQLPTEPPAEAQALAADHPMAQIVHVSQGCDLSVDGSSAHFLRGQQGEPQVRMWARPWTADEQDPATAALFAIMTGDICAPVTMNRGIFGWAPTVQLTTYLRRQPAPGWLRVMASSTVLGDTWFEEDHTVLDSTGAVVVQSRQLAMIPR
ncbi:acyl-CoA thioesterase [Rhodococcus sp. LBL1]|uniref:Acyl-CoA thioesterase n=1 Tax=Prescottella agglutinans TaxID=1644129 RepID=A0ABT6M3S6_9NOCA|nr:thioesterase family protein [Prescottella agglutinans]MDH6278948.1 acyl-CoA thioesterase [Prescottella agglutinans]MDH6680392.1 acyl-CoA thioesterase [Rhodococcus sp. LBL1]MDH6685821.1 acyl-CoA thioesterase [Rhodococcus sp. LBL2]